MTIKTFVLARRCGQELELSFNLGGPFEVEKQPAADAYTLTTIRALSKDFVERTTGQHATAGECLQDSDGHFRTIITIDDQG